tara:strand:+ start:86 stop:877 length:792 start_codon:yes stop_codon:yes gene_type:complete
MNITPRKSLGQNFLNDKNILKLIVDKGKIDENDIIIEIGPGTGNLTQKILEKNPKKLIVIEKDKKLSELLKVKFKNKITVLNADILKFSYISFFNMKIKIFGNLPYNISTTILTNLIKTSNLNNFCKKLIFMFQKEVADRILAKDNSKNYGRLSIMSSWKLDVMKIKDINPNSFYPKPKIKSTILEFVPKQKIYKINNPKNLEHITQVFFNLKRKMIKKPMKILFKDFEIVAKKLSLNLNLRPQNLDNETYFKICSEYESLFK